MTNLNAEPQAREARPEFDLVPKKVVQEIENLCGQAIAQAEIQWGGYGPSACFRVTLKNGRKVFVKGSWPGQEAHGAQTLRQEIAVYHALPLLSEVGSRYLGKVVEEDEDGWHLGLWDYIEGGVLPLPWTKEKALALVDRFIYLHEATQQRHEAIPLSMETNFVKDSFQPDVRWLRFSNDEERQEKLISIFADQDYARRWLKQVLPVFCELQIEMPKVGGRQGLCHNDLRRDNILVDHESNLRFIDWPDASYGPVLMDLVYTFSDAASESDLDPDDLLNAYQQRSGTVFEQRDVHRCLAALSGYFADHAYRAVPEKLPRLRWAQKKELMALLLWCQAQKLIPAPPELA